MGSDTMKSDPVSPLKRVVIMQLSVTMVVALALVLYGQVAAYSALMGGMIYVIANAVAARRIFSRKMNDTAQGELYAFYRAEIAKLVMIGALCVALFASVKPISIIAFIVGCGCAMIAGTIAAATQQLEYSADPGQPT